MEGLTAGLAVVVLYLFGSLRIIRQYERAGRPGSIARVTTLVAVWA